MGETTMKKLLLACALAGAIATVAAPVLVLISDEAAAQSQRKSGIACPNGKYVNGKWQCNPSR
jgi:hypothetical protein